MQVREQEEQPQSQPTTGTEAARHLAGMRRKVEKVCDLEECGRRYMGYAHSLYCCRAHMRRAYYLRNAE